MDSYLIFALVMIIILFLFIKLWLSMRHASKRLQQIPEVPGGLPIIGHLISLIRRPPWDTLSQWVLQYGPIIRFNLFGRQIIAINDRDMLKRVLQLKFTTYQKDKFTYGPFMCLLGTGLVTSEGPLWKQQRGFIAPTLRVEILEETGEIVKSAVNRLCKKLDNFKKSGEVVEIGEEFRKLTLQVIVEAILSLPADESDRVFPELYLPIVEEANRRTWYPFRAFLPLPATFRQTRAIKELNQYVTNLIIKRRNEYLQGNKTPDILGRILTSIDGQPWDEKLQLQLRDEIKTFLFAGHETSSAMLTWTLYELTRNPEVLEKVKKEANETFKDPNNFPSFDIIRDGLQYTQACLKEALRKYSIVPVVTRQLAEDDDLCGIPVPANTIVVVPIQAVHNDPTLWPDPQTVCFSLFCFLYFC